MSHGVVHFEIPADDAAKLSKFYADLFDWQIQKMPMGGMDYYMASTVQTDEQGMPTELGAINGGIAPRQSPDQRPVNYVQVESVDDYATKAVTLGATLLMGKMPVPGMGWFAQLADPEGNVFGVWQNDDAAG
jgi:predicted enzyme related to lactoylglutathione lyase